MPDEQDSFSLAGLAIRAYHPGDQAAVSRLYDEGLLAGQIAPNDTGADIDNIYVAYFDEPHNHFWVAELNGKVVGMIGVAAEENRVAEIRRLRVDKHWQMTSIPAKLLETAIDHVKKHGFLKVVLDTRFERDAVLSSFEKLGFQHTRTRNTANKELLEFYLDLYRQPKNEH
jgi:N-acetylglutamate synthase-like GNAT family acetyltransferase